MSASMHEEPAPKPKKPVDLSEMFDLSRDKSVARYVDQFEGLLRQKKVRSFFMGGGELTMSVWRIYEGAEADAGARAGA